MIAHTSEKTNNEPMFINYGREELGKDDQLAITVNWTLVSFSSLMMVPHNVPLGFPCPNRIVSDSPLLKFPEQRQLWVQRV